MSQWMYGRNTIIQRLETDQEIDVLYMQENAKVQKILDLAKKKRVKVVFKSKLEMQQMVKENHQGVIAQVKAYETWTIDKLLVRIGDKPLPLLVMCDQLEDPHNLGAILRTCDATGVDGVILSNHRSVSLNGTVAKVSTGAIDTVPVAMVTNLVNTCKMLKDKGYWIVGTDNHERAIHYSDLKCDMPIVLVVGSEGRGISRLMKETCDFMVKIPMLGQVTSLNVSVATGVLLYEVLRQRSQK